MAAEPNPTPPAPAAALAPPPPPPPAETLAAPPASAGADCRSFSQLLAGAMAPSPRGGVAQSLAQPVVAVPCFVVPAGMLESPTFTGQFAMTHQAVLATVTAQAQMQLQAAHPTSSDILSDSFPQPIVSTISPVPLQQMPPPVLVDSVCTPRVEQTQSDDHKSQYGQIALKMNRDDGYNWRKYGQKQVKSSENSRSYYKCTTANCSAKKKVERCPDGRVTEVMYRGQHSHDPPEQTRYSRERVVRSNGPLGENDSLELPNVEPNESDPSISKTEQNSGHEAQEQQLFCSSDCEGDAAIKTEEDLGDEPNPKRMLSENYVPCPYPVLKTFREPRIVVQAPSDVGRVSDGYRWRKYGQKIVKGNPNPRSYYRCTHNGCPVRKHVEKASDDAKSILISYEGKHNHDLPSLKNSSDPPASPIFASATAATLGEQLHSTDSLLEQKLPMDMPTDVDENITDAKALEHGGEKAVESVQARFSIGCNSSVGEDGGGADSEHAKPTLLNENPATVPVQNS